MFKPYNYLETRCLQMSVEKSNESVTSLVSERRQAFVQHSLHIAGMVFSLVFSGPGEAHPRRGM